MKPIAIVLDTNFFLQYQDIEAINWAEVLSGKVIDFCVIDPVLKELDKKKFQGSEREQKRARAAVKNFKQWFFDSKSAAIPDGSRIIAFHQKIEVSFEDFHLDPNVIDDRIIAYCLDIQNSCQYSSVVLLSADIGIQLKVKSHGLDFLELDDKYLLPSEKSGEQKEIERLKFEVAKLSTRTPNLSLEFNNSKSMIEFNRKPLYSLSSQRMNYLQSVLKSKYQPIPMERSELESTFPQFTSILSALGPSNEQKQNYNDRLQLFYDEYSKYLAEISFFRNWLRRSIPISLQLLNSGSQAAHDISVHLHFPDGFTLVNEDNFLEHPKRPPPPEKPRSFYNHLNGGFQPSGLPLLNRYFDRLSTGEPSNVSDVRIVRTNSYDVDFKVAKVRHSFHETIPDLRAVFDDISEAQSFHLDYKIFCDELREPKTGTLHVIIKK